MSSLLPFSISTSSQLYFRSSHFYFAPLYSNIAQWGSGKSSIPSSGYRGAPAVPSVSRSPVPNQLRPTIVTWCRCSSNHRSLTDKFYNPTHPPPLWTSSPRINQVDGSRLVKNTVVLLGKKRLPRVLCGSGRAILLLKKSRCLQGCDLITFWARQCRNFKLDPLIQGSFPLFGAFFRPLSNKQTPTNVNPD